MNPLSSGRSPTTSDSIAAVPTRVAIYLRVSSDTQRERETVKTQIYAIDQFLTGRSDIVEVERYIDDGFSGSIPFAQRPASARLLRDARAGRFDKILVTRADRLGRNVADLFQIRAQFERMGIELVGVIEPINDEFIFGIHALMAQDEKRRFLARSAEGMARAAQEGRYTGGIVPLGYEVRGRKETARLVPSEQPMWGGLTEAQIVVRIYDHVGIDRWSSRRVAEEFNRLGIPTAYAKAGRGVRGRKTQGIWRAGRIRNLLVNPVYKGLLQYGRRTTRRRDVIGAAITPLVRAELWDAAQATLAANRIIPKNTHRIYLLRSLIVCGLCALKYSGSQNRSSYRYVCNGKIAERGPVVGPCPGKSLTGPALDTAVLSDIERFLRNPGPLLDELTAEAAGQAAEDERVHELATLQAAQAEHTGQRDRILELFVKGYMSGQVLEEQMRQVNDSLAEIEERLTASQTATGDDPALALPADLLTELRRRLDRGLTSEQWQEIAQLLVKRIVVHTRLDGGVKHATVSIEYRFDAVVSTCTGKGSSPPAARSWPET